MAAPQYSSNQYNQKQSNSKKCRVNCAQHKFTLKPKSEKLYHSKIQVQYCPVQDSNRNIENVIPKINPDGKKYYPLFWIDVDKDHYTQHEDKYKEEHEKKVTDYIQQKDDMLEPKPGRKTKWCAVCKQQYKDYLEHVRGQEHVNSSNNNQYIKQLFKIAKNFSDKKRQDQQNMQVKSNTEECLNKENMSTTIENIDSDYVENQNQILKKKKTSQENNLLSSYNQANMQRNASYLNNSDQQYQNKNYTNNIPDQQQYYVNMNQANQNNMNMNKQIQLIQNQQVGSVFQQQQSNNSPTLIQSHHAYPLPCGNYQSENLSYNSQISKKRPYSTIHKSQMQQSQYKQPQQLVQSQQQSPQANLEQINKKIYQNNYQNNINLVNMQETEIMNNNNTNNNNTNNTTAATTNNSYYNNMNYSQQQQPQLQSQFQQQQNQNIPYQYQPQQSQQQVYTVGQMQIQQNQNYQNIMPNQYQQNIPLYSDFNNRWQIPNQKIDQNMNQNQYYNQYNPSFQQFQVQQQQQQQIPVYQNYQQINNKA